MAKKPTAAAPPAPPTPPTSPIAPETLPPPKPPAEPRQVGRGQLVLNVGGREILREASRCGRCGASNPAWRDLTAVKEAQEAREAYDKQLELFGTASVKLRVPNVWSTHGSHCADCSWSITLGARHKPLIAPPSPELKRARRELQELRATPGFADSARLRVAELDLMKRLDAMTPEPPKTRIPVGPQVLVSYSLDAGMDVPKIWTIIEARFGQGDFGIYGDIDGPPLTPEQKFAPPRFDRRIQNLAALEANRGIVAGRYHCELKRGSGTRVEEVGIVALLGVGVIAFRPELDHVSI